jgi:hypothetical protein
MKTALIRMLTLMTLAASTSAFAATNEPKHDGITTTSAGSQQSQCADTTSRGKKEKKEEKNYDRNRTDTNYDRVLMGIYG